MIKNKHIFLVITSHELMLVREIIRTSIDADDYTIFIFNEFNEVQYKLVSQFNDVVFFNSKNLRSKLNFFKLINYIVKEDSKEKNIYFYSSQYINFISNYLFRNKNINKILLSHGISNYVEPENDYTGSSFIPLNIFFIQRLLDRITNIFNLIKQFFILILCFKIYDFNFVHTTAFQKIAYDKGYFFSLTNLITRTKDDVLMKFEDYDIELPKKSYILYIEERSSSTIHNKFDREKLIKYLDDLQDIIVIQKPHPNMEQKKVQKIATRHEVIIAPFYIPAEYFIKKDRDITIIGPESSVLLNAKFINKNNKVILFDSKVKKYRHILELVEKFDIEVFN
jgi:hypothetical protein